MSRLRITLLILGLGWAAVIGWLCRPGPHVDHPAIGGRLFAGPGIDPAHNHPRPHHHFPARRQKTRPDPTPEDKEQPAAVDSGYDGPDPVGHAHQDISAPLRFADSPSPGWTGPACPAPLLQITRRFRC